MTRWESRSRVLCTVHCVTVIPGNVCSAVCWAAEAATVGAVHSRAGFPMRSTKDQKSRIACGNYVLSPKDLCTIDAIPALAESGIFSFKIEGRMKQAEYAAGVVSVYRQYMDRYLDRLNEERAGGCSEDEGTPAGEKAYAVTEEDHRKLLALGNRSGFTDGYYFPQKWQGDDYL